jgi:hypothetical protein
LGAPELRDNWWFAEGEIAENVDETFAIYNPTDEDVEVTVFFGGLPVSASAVNDGDPIEVPALRTVLFDPNELAGSGPSSGDDSAAEGQTDDTATPATTDQGDSESDVPSPELPEGRHATVFSTLAQPSIVVERTITRSVDGTIATSVVMGAPPRPDGFVANEWAMGIGPTEAAEDALIIYNIDQTEATVTVSAVGPDGVSVVPSLSDVSLPSGGIITVDLVDPAVLGRELIVGSTSRVFVERSLPRNNDLPGRSGSWLLPVSG